MKGCWYPSEAAERVTVTPAVLGSRCRQVDARKVAAEARGEKLRGVAAAKDPKRARVLAMFSATGTAVLFRVV